MFNGIIKNTGRINKITKKNNNCFLELSTKMQFNHNEIGSSISCSGVCLTLDQYKKKLCKFYLSKETLKRTNFRYSKIGEKINLEKSLKFGERISGHFVQGHVDTTSQIKSIKKVGKSLVINFQLSKKYKKYIVEKGSISINGVSLTIAKILPNAFEITVIPKTLQLTNLIEIKKKDIVNIEFDIFGKYIKGFVNKK